MQEQEGDEGGRPRPAVGGTSAEQRAEDAAAPVDQQDQADGRFVEGHAADQERHDVGVDGELAGHLQQRCQVGERHPAPGQRPQLLRRGDAGRAGDGRQQAQEQRQAEQRDPGEQQEQAAPTPELADQGAQRYAQHQ